MIGNSITLDGTTFLIETKFTQKPVAPDDIDSFMSKIKRKADNTMGIMVSISGFTGNAKEIASADRTPMILMDHSHFYNLIFPQIMSLPEVIERVWRNASQTGKSFLDTKDF